MPGMANHIRPRAAFYTVLPQKATSFLCTHMNITKTPEWSRKHKLQYACKACMKPDKELCADQKMLTDHL